MAKHLAFAFLVVAVFLSPIVFANPIAEKEFKSFINLFRSLPLLTLQSNNFGYNGNVVGAT